jgi:hypothetical protein
MCVDKPEASYNEVARAHPDLMSNQNSVPPSESLLIRSQRLKRADRARLSELSPDQAQQQAEAILDPNHWKVADLKELEWPGDLGDALDDPSWLDSE